MFLCLTSEDGPETNDDFKVENPCIGNLILRGHHQIKLTF